MVEPVGLVVGLHDGSTGALPVGPIVGDEVGFIVGVGAVGCGVGC